MKNVFNVEYIHVVKEHNSIEMKGWFNYCRGFSATNVTFKLQQSLLIYTVVSFWH